MAEKIKLIYIASTGRSGSTLLEMILGTHPDVVNCGEIQIWPHEFQEAVIHQPCSCGSTVQQCLFWNTLKERINPLEQAYPQIHAFREDYSKGKLFRKDLLEIFKGRLSEQTKTRISIYGKNNYYVFQEYRKLYAEVTGKKPTYLVDSSKDPYRLFFLANSELFDIKVLHVVKDPRGFIYSLTRRSKFKNNDLFLLKKTFNGAVSYVVRNEIIHNLTKHKRLANATKLIRYEDLARDPEALLSDVFSLLDLEFNSAKILKDFWTSESHTIAGNSLRARKGEKIRLDEKWKKELPMINQKLAYLLTFNTSKKFGY